MGKEINTRGNITLYFTLYAYSIITEMEVILWRLTYEKKGVKLNNHFYLNKYQWFKINNIK